MTHPPAVLVVEDDAFTGRMMELQFRKHGFDITLAANGEEALACFSAGRFDLVLTDVMMPGMSGLDVLARLRETHDKRSLPVILITALDDAAGILKGLNLGANDYLGKTNEFGLILARVNLHLELKRLYALEAGGSAETQTPGTRVPGDAPWSWNFLNDQVHYSARFHDILGLPPKSMAATPEALWSRVHPDDVAAVQHALDAHRERRASHFEADFRMAHAGGGYVHVHAFGMAGFGKDGRPQRLMAGLFLTAPPPG